MILYTVLYYLLRTPPLTLLHLSASKFNDAPSAGGITGWSVGSTRQPSTQPPLKLKSDSPCKQPGTIQSFFQKAAEKQRQVRKDPEDEDTEIRSSSSYQKTCVTDTHSETDDSYLVSSIKLNNHSKAESAAPKSGLSAFFHKKTLERSLKASASTQNESDVSQRTEPVNTEESENTVAVESGLLEKSSSALAAHLSPCEKLTAELDVNSDVNHHLPSVAREDLLICERCGQEVSVWEMPEHNDYHFAVDLQNSLSSSTSSVTCTASSSSRQGATGLAQSCRGKTKSRSHSGPQPKRHRSQGASMGTLDSFFKRS